MAERVRHFSPPLIGWQLRRDMSEKKRTTVTTIETREVWIIRRPVPEPADEAVTITPVDTSEPAKAVSPLSELTTSPETNKEQGS